MLKLSIFNVKIILFSGKITFSMLKLLFNVKMETWKNGSMEKWKHGKTWKNGDMETWKHGKIVTWKYGHGN